MTVKKIRQLAKKSWKDPVLSNLIANALTALVAWIFYSITTATSAVTYNPVEKIRPGSHIPHTTHFLHTTAGHILTYGIHAVFIIAFVISFRGVVKGYLRKSSGRARAKGKIVKS
jgi:hypothetical protein